MTEQPLTLDTEPEIEPELHETPPEKRWVRLGMSLLILMLCLLTAGYWYVSYLNTPTEDFPVNEPVLIESGLGVKAITERLAEEGVVRSASLLYYILAIYHDPTDVKASTYVFDEPITTYAVAIRLTEGDFNSDLVRFVHFEGERASAIAERASERLQNFDKERFLEQTADLEGRLFPDTYFVPTSFTDEDFLSLFLETYEERMVKLRPRIESQSLTEEEVIILASIIEREANDPDSMRNVARVFLNRLDIGMALQADASIEYVIETPLGRLPPGQLAENLRELDTPYNTYLYPGLPPGPIGNPGLDSIMAVLDPADTDYFYYLTADDGTFHYARTYDKHLENIERHLR